MRSIKKSRLAILAVATFAGAGLLFVPGQEARAGGFSFNIPFLGFHISPGYGYHHYHYRPGYYYYNYDPCCPGGYYRTYHYHDPYAPTIEREVYEKEYRGPDGRVHEEQRIEERRESRYIPGPDGVAPPPRQTARGGYEPGVVESRERNEWIAMDDRPDLIHTEPREDVTDDESLRTDTEVDLKDRTETTDDLGRRVTEESNVDESTDDIARPGPHDEQ